MPKIMLHMTTKAKIHHFVKLLNGILRNQILNELGVLLVVLYSRNFSSMG